MKPILAQARAIQELEARLAAERSARERAEVVEVLRAEGAVVCEKPLTILAHDLERGKELEAMLPEAFIIVKADEFNT